MASYQDSWLYCLAQHPIFELTDTEKEYASYIKTKQTTDKKDITSFLLQHHNRVIAVRDNDLFVAIRQQIRVLNMTAFKDSWLKVSKEATQYQTTLSSDWIHTVSYRVLDTPEINFNIESLLPNNNGRLLSVHGTHQVVVVCLPRQGFNSISEYELSSNKTLCRTLTIGKNTFNLQKTQILQVSWHPLSETRTHIVILGNDSILRMYDICADIDKPEQMFDLSPADNNISIPSSGYGFDEGNNEEDAVSFSLGGNSLSSSAWEPFTVYYALRSGHIYALCPFIPYKSVVSRNQLENLSCISHAKYEQARRSDAHEHRYLSHLYSLQMDWIQRLLSTAKTSSIILEKDMVSITSNDSHISYPPRRQGPFSISHDNCLMDGTQVVDILFTNSNPVHIITLALSNGTVRNYIIGSEIDAVWLFNTKKSKERWEKELNNILLHSDHLPRASLYEIISIKSHQLPVYQHMTLVPDALYEDSYYVYHSGGVHAIVMKQWLDNLKKISQSYENGQNESASVGLNEWLKEKSTSSVRCIVNSSPYSGTFVPIVGLVVITDIYLSYSLLALTSEYGLITKEMNVRRDLSISDQADGAMKAQLRDLGDNGNTEKPYEVGLPLPLFELPKQFDNFPSQAKIVIPSTMDGKKEIVINEETFKFFTKSAEQVRREIRQLHKAAVKVDNRLVLQQNEFKRQVKAVRDLYDRMQLQCSQEAKQKREDALKTIEGKHLQLRLRFESLLRQIMSNYQPGLTRKEEEWIDKLDELSNKVNGPSGYKARIELVSNN
ncbi:hypothetical protein BDB01DRAFT_724658 [Pilobolus umbonatus]|nr:hypothetical protein BDB01DRAFT_724658 [Pilobolus umbonatus]